ncbi:hypothetical protein A2U01_0097613, partial [Trifolium medium]|nr:hypothetical protein [Trifolium medium]
TQSTVLERFKDRKICGSGVIAKEDCESVVAASFLAPLRYGLSRHRPVSYRPDLVDPFFIAKAARSYSRCFNS